MKPEDRQAILEQIKRLEATLDEGDRQPRAPAKAVTIKREERLVVRFSGVNRAARALGISPTHLTFILHGKRSPGPKLAEKMNKLGIPFPGTAAK